MEDVSKIICNLPDSYSCFVSLISTIENSRLHFNGTGRNRYRMRFPNLSDGFKNARSDVNTEKVVINIDMDHCELLDKPVAVCHSDSSRGVKAGMFVKEVKTRYPKLMADQFYDILHKHCRMIFVDIGSMIFGFH
ncbi:hypothetical protein ACS0TY_000196 [Phlomoides rotata]